VQLPLPQPASFEWDEGNMDKNWLKHRVTYKETEEIFFETPILFFDDKTHSNQEQRFIAFGTTKNKRLLFVVFTIRKHRIRIISARSQDRDERSFYEQQTNKE
jgi:hypothetical protein